MTAVVLVLAGMAIGAGLGIAATVLLARRY